MKEKRFWFGLVATVLWLCYTAYMLVAHKAPTELNTWGDFFAGFFAPLAFLWLVLGYLQQGEELKHSTEALRLQAEELKNSVEQQSQLVAVSRDQVRQEYEVLQEERERRRDAARPKFIPQLSTTVASGARVEYKLKVANVGNTATRFRMSFAPTLLTPKHHNLALVARDQVVAIDFEFANEKQVEATIQYYDADGMPGEVNFILHEVTHNRLEIGEVERTL